MSRAALVVVILLAALLAGVLVFTSGPSSPTTPGTTPGAPSDGPPLDFEPGRIERVTLRRPGAASETIARAGAGRWSLRDGPAGWPVDPGAAERLLRRLAELRPAAGAEASEADLSEGLTVSLVRVEGAPLELRLGATPVAGVVAARVGAGDPFATDASILEELSAGFGPWRRAEAFPGLNPVDASRLSVRADEREVEVARLDGRWRVRRPIAARANATAVENALAALGTMRIERFAGGVSDRDAGLDEPHLVFAVERDVRSIAPDGSVRVETRATALRIGAFAGPERASVFARLDAHPGVTFVVPAAAATSISTAARNYLDPFATDAEPADVAMIVIKPRSGADRAFRRDLGSWTRAPGGERTDGAPIDEALAFLRSTPGEPQESFAESDILPVARLELYGFDDDRLDTLTLGYTADNFLALRAGGVVWLHPPDAAPPLFDMPDPRDVSPRATPAAPPPPADDAPAK